MKALGLHTDVVHTPVCLIPRESPFRSRECDTVVDQIVTRYHNFDTDVLDALLSAHRFTGTSVAVFGAVNSNHGVYTVLCDGIAAK